MRKTAHYIADLKAHFNVTSDYALAQKLGISPNRISNYQTGKSRFDDYMCAQVAEILGLDPLEVIADINHERETRPEARKYWERLAAGIRRTAAALLLALVGLTSPIDTAQAQQGPSIINTGHKRRRFALAALLAAALGMTPALADPAFTLSLASKHLGTSKDYNETNPGIGFESSLQAEFIGGGIYIDSHDRPTGYAMTGYRARLAPWLHAGFAGVFTWNKEIEHGGFVGVVTAGSERAALNLVYTPKVERKHDTRPAVLALQARFSF